MPTTITITLADNSHTAVEHAINHARAIERDFESVGCPALIEVHTGSLADDSAATELARIRSIITAQADRHLHYASMADMDSVNPGFIQRKYARYYALMNLLALI